MSMSLVNGKLYQFEIFEQSGDTVTVFKVLRVDEGCVSAATILPDKDEVDKDVYEEDMVDVAVVEILRTIDLWDDNRVDEDHAGDIFTIIRVGKGDWYTTYFPYDIEIEEVK